MKTSRIALDPYKTFNLYKVLNIHKILLPLDDRNGTYRVSKVREDKANRLVLGAEEITILLSINIKA